ncbi:hypothetical protein MMC17_000024 [Xylographa soralifera]|nr:hypothetical protein [Xylographa soralifera]
MASMHRIVVGIDFGTTYTAVCWNWSSNSTGANLVDHSHSEIIKNWPTSGNLVGMQVPSEIAYRDGDTTEYSWGYDIGPREKKLKWFKLGLETDKEVLSLPTGLTAQAVVRDFLSALYKHVMKTLYRRFERAVMQMTQVDFILTVPAIWSDAAKKKTEAAAKAAGLGNEHGLELLSEPESAAIFTLKNLDTTHSQIKVHDRIVVCDAGGGTVDLISYEIRRTHPSLSVMECAPGTGEYCGSTFIDQEFSKLFEKRMGNHYGSLSGPNRQQVVKNFETTKIAFRDDPAQTRFYVNIPTIGNIEDAGVYGGNFEITREEMRSLFDPIIEQVLALIRAQVMAASTGSQSVNCILLVGGFGESEYLYNRTFTWASQYDIQVIQPREASTAIVRGAVMKGLEPKAGPERTEIVRRARRSFGVPSTEPFIEGKHLEQDRFIDPASGKVLARHQISWFIRKNQIMPDDATFRHSFIRNFKQTTLWTDRLVSSTLDVQPTRWSPQDPFVKKHCTITSDLTQLNKKDNFERRWRRFRRYYTAEYDLVMGVKNNNLTILLEHKGQKFGVANVEFEDL